MINNIKKCGKYILLTAGVLAICAIPVACNSNKEISSPTISYGPEIGFADGNVDLSAETPIINISDIKSPVGENIDFLSGVAIVNEDDFENLEIWVDASLVDIFTPGDYTATYTFNYDGKSESSSITVTIFESESEQSASDTVSQQAGSTSGEASTTSGKEHSSGNENATSGNLSANDNTSASNSTGNSNNSTSSSAGSSNGTTSSSGGSSNITTSSSGGSSNETTTAQKPTSTKKPTSTEKSTTPPKSTSPQATSTTRQIITTAGNETTESKNIGNYTIELLSGKTITIRNTTAKYIVSTRTDVTTTTRNGKTYRVSNLIITFNTGATQILETVEERIK